MKCPKCGYASFPHVESCRKCGQGLTEHRVAFGLYALRPDPPDLLMAYQTSLTDANATTQTPALPSPGTDPGPLDEIELELAGAEDAASAAEVDQEPASGAVDLTPTTPLDPAPELGPLRVESESGQTKRQDGVIPPAFELSALRDDTLELEHAADLGDTSRKSTQTPTGPSEVGPVYNLDLEGDLDGLTLGSEVDESPADAREEGTTEYILEIEDELELEVDELKLDEADESEGEDDHDR